jgi:hypothetical protein
MVFFILHEISRKFVKLRTFNEKQSDKGEDDALLF